MKEAEYAEAKYTSAHRTISLLVMIGLIVYAIKIGDLRIVRTVTCLGISFTCIWFPDDLATINIHLKPRLIRWLGWLLLIFYAIFRLVLNWY
jgi:hypothetical protein